MLRLTTCSSLLIILLVCSSGKLKLVAVLVLVLFNIFFLNWYDVTSYSIVLPVLTSALLFRMWSICYRCTIYFRFALASPTCLSVSAYVKILLIVLMFFIIVFLNCCDVMSYSIVLPVSISALVFQLWSFFMCIINEGYLGYFIEMKVYRVCTSFD